MTIANRGRTTLGALSSARTLADQTFARAPGAPLVPGNTVRILKDAKENYPAWLEAIASATKTIHFETYIIHRDDIGLEFAEALAESAQRDVRVRSFLGWNPERGVEPWRDTGVVIEGPAVAESNWHSRKHGRLQARRFRQTHGSATELAIFGDFVDILRLGPFAEPLTTAD